MTHKLHRLTVLAMAVSLAVILSYVEHLVPISASVPGIKAGFANIAVIFVLYRIGVPEAVAVSVVRILIVALLFGSAVSLIYSLSGAVVSFLVMLALKHLNFHSTLGVSVAGGVAHNAGQIGAACVVMGSTQIAYYLPVLIITGTIAGIFVGLISSLLVQRVPIR